jgi:hypothetical protein
MAMKTKSGDRKISARNATTISKARLDARPNPAPDWPGLDLFLFLSSICLSTKSTALLICSSYQENLNYR